MLLASLGADLYVAPKANAVKLPRDFCRRAAPYLGEVGHVYLFGGDKAGVYNLCTGRLTMPVLQQAEELREVLAARARAVVIIQESSRIDTLSSDCPYPIPVREMVGGAMMELVINWEPEAERIRP